jgi:hypothetical protein
MRDTTDNVSVYKRDGCQAGGGPASAGGRSLQVECRRAAVVAASPVTASSVLLYRLIFTSGVATRPPHYPYLSSTSSPCITEPHSTRGFVCKNGLSRSVRRRHIFAFIKTKACLFNLWWIGFGPQRSTQNICLLCYNSKTCLCFLLVILSKGVDDWLNLIGDTLPI